MLSVPYFSDALLRPATPDDLPGILAIFNHAIEHTTAAWTSTPVDLDNRRAWMYAREQKGFHILVAVKNDTVLGYASYGEWRTIDGYRHTVEHSIYIHPQAQGQGLGKKLMHALISHAQAHRVHVMIAAVDASNEASIQLHKALGFREAGLFREVDTKFGRWLDLLCLELKLDERTTPAG